MTVYMHSSLQVRRLYVGKAGRANQIAQPRSVARGRASLADTVGSKHEKIAIVKGATPKTQTPWLVEPHAHACFQKSERAPLQARGAQSNVGQLAHNAQNVKHGMRATHVARCFLKSGEARGHGGSAPHEAAKAPAEAHK